jgi:hypothetical protein
MAAILALVLLLCSAIQGNPLGSSPAPPPYHLILTNSKLIQVELSAYRSSEAGILVMLNFLDCCGADLGCLSRIPDLDFYPSRIPDLGSRIPDPTTAAKEKWEKNLLSYLFCGHKYYKIQNYFISKLAKKKIWANLQRIVELFPKKLALKGHGNEADFLGFLRKLVPHESLTLPFKPFRFLL